MLSRTSGEASRGALPSGRLILSLPLCKIASRSPTLSFFLFTHSHTYAILPAGAAIGTLKRRVLLAFTGTIALN